VEPEEIEPDVQHRPCAFLGEAHPGEPRRNGVPDFATRVRGAAMEEGDRADELPRRSQHGGELEQVAFGLELGRAQPAKECLAESVGLHRLAVEIPDDLWVSVECKEGGRIRDAEATERQTRRLYRKIRMGDPTDHGCSVGAMSAEARR
jgi:hypothetical protein